MTDPATEEQQLAAAAAELGEDPYSKDYWDNAFQQIGRRPFVKVALGVLALLYGLAIYAPLIANDRPYVLEAIDAKAYATDQKTLYAVAAQVAIKVKKGAEAVLADRPEDAAPVTFEEVLREEQRALELKLGTIRKHVAPDLHGPLDELETKVKLAIDAAVTGDDEKAKALSAEAKDMAKAVRTDFKPLVPEAPEAGGIELVAVKSYPLLESTVALEIFFMCLWAFVLLWPLWNRLVNRLVLGGDKERIRRARRKKWAGVLGSSLLAAIGWQVGVGGQATFETAPYKTGLTTGETVATRASFPPLAMGFAENSLGERNRAPTWHGTSEINEEGYYVRGPRAPEPDPVTGHMPPPTPVDVRYAEPDRNSTWRHVLGTDSMGRDLLVRLLYGARISLSIGILSTVLLVFIGVVIGAVAGYFGGRVDIAISRLIEVVQSFPAFFLILTAVALIPEDKIHPIFAIVFFIAVVRWTGVARLVRGEFLRLKELDFVMASRALGFSAPRTIFRHVLPNALGPVLVAAAFSVASGILTESAISFLGLGVKLPIPSWGSILNDARGTAEYWWIQVFPGVLIFLTVFCYNVVGEGVRDALDPRRQV